MHRILLNIQRTNLHDSLLKRGIDPGVTRWTNATKGWTDSDVETLEVGLCHFLFSPAGDGEMNIHLKPSENGGAEHGYVGLSWDEVLNLFERWTVSVKQELAHEDPWLKYSAYFPPERMEQAKDNSPFTFQEAEHAAASILQFRETVRTKLPSYKSVESTFDPQFARLAEQAKTGMGRIDWSNQFVGMLISLCMTLSVQPEVASSLWQSWIAIIDRLLL